MKNAAVKLALSLAALGAVVHGSALPEAWPDGTPVLDWFMMDAKPRLEDLGKRYDLVECGIFPSAEIQTAAIQSLVDRIAASGGGVVVVPPGIYTTGGLVFPKGVNLWLENGAVLRGSDDIADYPFDEKARIEGETCPYFGALLNVDSADGFTLGGEGVVDGNGHRFWRSFWLRRRWNPKCTNKDEQRPRILFVRNSDDVRIDGVTFQNSPFWTTHFHRCERLRITNAKFYALGGAEGRKGPSTDAIDLDVVKNVLVKGCHVAVNDDGIAVKGGKGPWADDFGKHPENGPNVNILVEDCTFASPTHTALTLGSECVRNRNIVFRNSRLDGAGCGFRLKMRTDTPQLDEFVRVEGISGVCRSFIATAAWSQFADLKGRGSADVFSRGRKLTVRNCDVSCGGDFWTMGGTEYFSLEDVTLENLAIGAKSPGFDEKSVKNLSMRNVRFR